MEERDTHRTNTEARADVAARGPRAAADSALLRYLGAAAYRQADTEHATGPDGDEEAVDEHPTTAGESGTEHG
jgi:hypothetical protein